MTNARIDLSTLKRGEETTRGSEPLCIIRAELLKRAWKKYKDRIITAAQLFIICSKLVADFIKNFAHTICDYNVGNLFFHYLQLVKKISRFEKILLWNQHGFFTKIVEV